MSQLELKDPLEIWLLWLIWGFLACLFAFLIAAAVGWQGAPIFLAIGPFVIMALGQLHCILRYRGVL